MIRLEDIAEGPSKELRRLEDFLGLPARTEAIGIKTNHMMQHRIPDKRKWSEIDLQGFYRIAGDTMAKLGYPTPSKDAERPLFTFCPRLTPS